METLLRYATRCPGRLKSRHRCGPAVVRDVISTRSRSVSSSLSSSLLGSDELWCNGSGTTKPQHHQLGRSFSSWDYPELPWTNAQTEKTTQQLFQRMEGFRREHQQNLELQEALMILVKQHLEQNYKEAFTIQTAGQFWKKADQNANSKSNNRNSRTGERQQMSDDDNGDKNSTIRIHDALVELTKLNGFEPVALPKEPVTLAEGIVVRPQYHKNENSRKLNTPRKAPIMWARSEFKKGSKGAPLPYSPSVMSSAQHRIDDLPQLVEEDIKLYRIIENNVEDVLNDLYGTFQANVKAIETKVQNTVNAMFPSLRRQEDAIKGRKEISVKDSINPDSHESLLFLDRNEIIWVTNIDHPGLRLLALANHHNYGHKVSSALISISLVVFGAIPLAYRSYNFAYDYPGLSQTVAASVLLTISYGIWSTQSKAVTRQSQVVSHAIAHRIYARNNAVLWALQQGAVERVTDGLLSYYFHCQNNTQQRLRLRPPSSSSAKPLLSIISGNVSSEHDGPILPSTSVDITALATEIGLVQEEKREDDKSNIKSSKWTAVPLEDAISAAKNYSTKVVR